METWPRYPWCVAGRRAQDNGVSELGDHACGGVFDVSSPFASKVNITPTVMELLQAEDSKITPRDVLPVSTILYIGLGGRRQWPIGQTMASLTRVPQTARGIRSTSLSSFGPTQNSESSALCCLGPD